MLLSVPMSVLAAFIGMGVVLVIAQWGTDPKDRVEIIRALGDLFRRTRNQTGPAPDNREIEPSVQRRRKRRKRRLLNPPADR